ncbi:MAG: precorrin-4 C(11)-methyltransferase [Salinarimonas sp.]
MTVHFIGAGPGAPDLITVRGRALVERCPVCLFAGSIVPPEILAWCPAGARIVDTDPPDLDAILPEIEAAHAAGEDVARLHSGDLSVWSAMGEQIAALEARSIPYTVTPGVPSFAAAAAALGRELTVPEVAQSVVLTRTPGRASKMPETERLSAFAATRATLAIHLSIHRIEDVVDDLIPAYGPDCPAAVVWRASWPDERVIRAPLSDLAAAVRDAKLERTALILVGPALAGAGAARSRLYAAHFRRAFGPGWDGGACGAP